VKVKVKVRAKVKLGGTPENRPTKDTAKPANGQAADWVFMPVAAQISYQPSFGSSVARR
jgi:hypothetical protein